MPNADLGAERAGWFLQGRRIHGSPPPWSVTLANGYCCEKHTFCDLQVDAGLIVLALCCALWKFVGSVALGFQGFVTVNLWCTSNCQRAIVGLDTIWDMNSATSVQNTGVKLLAVYSLGSWLTETENGLIKPKYYSVPTKTQVSIFLGTPGEDYFKGNPKSLNFYFLVIWWGVRATSSMEAWKWNNGPNFGRQVTATHLPGPPGLHCSMGTMGERVLGSPRKSVKA